jgi:outer membrane biosynthesis protein TonB
MHTKRYNYSWVITFIIALGAILMPITFTFAAKKERLLKAVSLTVGAQISATTTPPQPIVATTTILTPIDPLPTLPATTTPPTPDPTPTAPVVVTEPPQKDPPQATTTPKKEEPKQKLPKVPFPIPAKQATTTATSTPATSTAIMSFIQNGSPLTNLYSFSGRLTPTETNNMLALASTAGAVGLLLVDGRLLRRLRRPKGVPNLKLKEPSASRA